VNKFFAKVTCKLIGVLTALIWIGGILGVIGVFFTGGVKAGITVIPALLLVPFFTGLLNVVCAMYEIMAEQTK
jgi:hypothetical protein